VTNQEFTVENLKERIARVVGERQRLRAAQATPDELEANRSEIAVLQHELSAALIALHLPSPQLGIA
jgi:hypothetical protein